MNSYHEKLFSGFVRPILLVLLFAALAMTLLMGLETLFPDFLRYAFDSYLLYAAGGALILLFYFLKRSSEEASATKADEADSKDLDSIPETPQPSLEEIRKRMRSRKGKER